MASTAIAGGGYQVLDGSNPAVVRVRQLIGGTEYASPSGAYIYIYIYMIIELIINSQRFGVDLYSFSTYIHGLIDAPTIV